MKLTAYLLAAGLSAAWAVNVPPNFRPGRDIKFQIVIQSTLDFNAPFQPADATVWDLDLYHVARHPKIADHLRSMNPNATLICYFNAGLAQTSDCDYSTRWADSGLLGNPYSPDQPDFAEERWINIRSQAARDLVKRRITLARDIGCDAADPDNIDGYLHDEERGEDGTGWDLTEDDYVDFVTELAEHAHGLTTLRGYTMLIGQKNAPELVERLERVLDFAVFGDCKTLNDEEDYTFCRDFQTYIAAGKPVFSIEYPSTLGDRGSYSAEGASADKYKASCNESVGNSGFSTVLKIQGGDGELNGCTQYCVEGDPSEGVVVTVTDSELDGTECPPEAE